VSCKKIISAEYVRLLVSYDGMTGLLTWLPRSREFFASDKSCKTWNTRFSGKIAGSPTEAGHRRICLLDKSYKEHHVVWMHCHGRKHVGQIDHINHNRSDNRIQNLREISGNSENQKNAALDIRNKSGVNGVRWCENRKKWLAQIKSEGKAYNLGRYDSFDEAIAARQSANLKYGFHPNHGKAVSA
jgi:hypothetical protein